MEDMEITPFYFQKKISKNINIKNIKIQDFQKSIDDFNIGKMPSNDIGTIFSDFFVFLSMILIKDEYPSNNVYLPFTIDDISYYIELAYGVYMIECGLDIPPQYQKNYFSNISYVYNIDHIFYNLELRSICKNIKKFEDIDIFKIILLANLLMAHDMTKSINIYAYDLKFYMSDMIKTKIKDFIIKTQNKNDDIMIIPTLIRGPGYGHIGFFYIMDNKFSYYEPHGACYDKTLGESHDLIYDEMSKYVDELNKSILTLYKPLKIYRIVSTCAQKGIQTIECEIDPNPQDIKFGFCSGWSRLIIEEIFKNAGRVKVNDNLPKYIEKQILKEIKDNNWSSPQEYIIAYSYELYNKFISGFFNEFFFYAKNNFDRRMKL